MSPETRKLLEEFAKQVRWHGAASPDDQNRFFDVVIFAYTNGDHAIEQDDFIDVLNAYDSDRENPAITPAQKKRGVMTKLYTFHRYEEGIKLLKRFSK